MTMNPGLLNTPIELMLQSGSVERSSYGQPTVQYSGSICFARVVRKSGDEAVVNGIGSDSATYTFLIRYRNDVNENTKVKFEGREYNVTFVAEPYRRAYLELTTERLKH